MQSVEIYIYVDGVVNRIELFNDEKISLVSSIQQFSDLGKLFCDYSQSFTIPASKHNNKIFKHWYESSVGESIEDSLDLVEGSAFDHRVRYYGYIEINTIPFRDGKFTMEKANKKNGFIESYTINFIGNLVQLKDKFKDDKINSLVRDNGVSYYDELNFNYEYAEVADRFSGTSTDQNIFFPLIGNDRRFECSTSTPSDILTTVGAIDYRTLFPAIRVSKILEYIQDYYGLAFEGAFLNSEVITKLSMYCKNAETFNFYGEPLAPNFTTKDTGFTQFDLATDTLTFSFNEASNLHRFESWLRINTTSTVKYTMDIYDNGSLFASYTGLTGTQDIGFFNTYIENETIINGLYYTHRFTYRITSSLPMTFTARVQLKRDYGHPTTFYNKFAYTPSQSTSGNLQIKKYLPDLKVEEFLTGIVKMFNLVIIPTAENTFEFKQLETWYQEGRIVDVTKFINQPEAEINKPKLYKRIDFKFEKSENVLNNAFRSLFNQEYGDLFYDNTNSAYNENYEVKVPFENIMYERYTGTNFFTATNWNKDLKPYTPKPVLMYDNGVEDLVVGGSPDNYVTYDGFGNYYVSSYRRFSNEIYLGGTDTSYLLPLNWGVEQSAWELQNAPNGLFNRYYSNYIFNLYNQRTRVLKVKGLFTPYLLSTLKLNDRLIVSNKRYIINTLTTDLTTGEVELELLTDFRAEIQGVSQLRYSNIPQLSVDRTSQIVQFMIYKIDYDTFDVKLSTDFLSYPLTTDNDADILLDVTIPANTTASDRSDVIILEYFKNGDSTIIQIHVLQYA